MRRPSILGPVLGTMVSFVILAALSYMLLNSDGANYKVLVAVWLWLLPMIGTFAGTGYAAGRIVEVFGAKRAGDAGGLRADAR